MLKLKFETIHNSHQGQQIPQKLLFKESIKLNIPPSGWEEFIKNELKRPEKYSYFMKKDKKLKNYLTYTYHFILGLAWK